MNEAEIIRAETGKTSPSDDWETIIGLEVHVQLNTQTKLFSSAPNRFGDEPNTNIDPVCLGLPGVLPVVNKEAVRKAIQLGGALDATVQPKSYFDRKSYFYPDSPRNFQITQFFHPIIEEGRLEAELEGKSIIFDIERAHLEDDAGMLKHFSQFAGVDYNRAGAPLIEIVSKPCMRSAKEARAYIEALKMLLEYIDISECNMEEGHLRVDVNVSVRKRSEKEFRPKAEIKNMNSISAIENAIEAEVKRQTHLYENHPDSAPEELMKQATYRWDPEKGETLVMRRKETADDYRYFPEPDLPPLMIDREFIESVKSKLQELPLERKRRYAQSYQINHEHIDLLLNDVKLGNFFEQALKHCPKPKTQAQSISNWIVVEFMGRCKEKNIKLISCGIKPVYIAELVQLIESGMITGRIAKSIADDMLANPTLSPEEIIASNPDYQALSDSSQLDVIVDKVMNDHPQAVQDYREGRNKAYGFLVGKIMAESKGKANPKIVNELLRAKLEA